MQVPEDGNIQYGVKFEDGDYDWPYETYAEAAEEIEFWRQQGENPVAIVRREVEISPWQEVERL